jgi:hypothetical protein
VAPHWLGIVGLALLACAGTESTLITTGSGPADAAGGSAGSAGSAGSGPTPGMSMQIQLTGELDPSFDVDLYDIDLHTNSAADFAALRAAGRLVACYFSAGTLESWRDDAEDLPAAVIGNPHAQYPSERWLDVGSEAVRGLMRSRIELAKTKGCDAVQPANAAVSAADPGFPITPAVNREFALFLAQAAHELGLWVAWSDDPNVFPGLEQVYDFGLAIQCIQYGRCEAWAGFRNAGKALFVIEIGDASDTTRVCPAAASLGLPAIIKDNDYSAFRIGCP